VLIDTAVWTWRDPTVSQSHLVQRRGAQWARLVCDMVLELVRLAAKSSVLRSWPRDSRASSHRDAGSLWRRAREVQLLLAGLGISVACRGRFADRGSR